jgi:hypothetical protein
MSETRYIPVRTAMQKYCMCRETVLKTAEAMGALHRFGRVIRIDTVQMERQPDKAEKVG